MGHAWVRALIPVLLLVSPGAALAPAKPVDEHAVLAAGQLRFGHLYRDRDQRRLTTDSFGRVETRDATLRGYAFQALADLDLHVENTLSDEAVVDFTNRLRLEFDSPDDVQGNRYRFADNMFSVLWGVALHPDTTLRTDFLARVHHDLLFPELTAVSAGLGLTLDTALARDAWLTFAFSLEGTGFSRSVSDGYLEGGVRVAYQAYRPSQIEYEPLPAPVRYPRPGERDPVFRYAAELDLHESKKLLPLGPESLVGRSAPVPLVVSPFDRLFREHETAAASFSGVEVGVRGRDYQGTFFPDYRRFEAAAFHQVALRRGLLLWIEDRLAWQPYRDAQPARTFANRLENRARLEIVRTARRSQVGGHVALGLYRFPDFDTLDIDVPEVGLRGLYRFGRRYWLLSDLGWLAQVPERDRPAYPRRDHAFATTGFTVDFSPLQSLTLTARSSRIRIPRFETEFDYDFADRIGEVRYHHRLRKTLAVEAGTRRHTRRARTQVANDRSESLVFVESILDL
jgi:hypothetical protein